MTAPAVLVGAALLSAHSGVTQAQSASEPTVIQVKAGRTWSVWQLAQVDLGATYCARVTFECADYESTIAGNVWSPAAYPQGWRKL